MAKIVRLYLHDILQEVADIERAIAGKSLQDYLADRVLLRSIERSVEIVSEASRHIPSELKNTQPQIPWKKIQGIGNVLRHEYRSVVNEVIYGTATLDMPELKAAILAIDAALDEPRE